MTAISRIACFGSRSWVGSLILGLTLKAVRVSAIGLAIGRGEERISRRNPDEEQMDPDRLNSPSTCTVTLEVLGARIKFCSATEESASVNRRLIERAYKYRPVKVVEFELPRPQCVVYLDLKREECVGLFPSGRVYSQAFHLGGQGFFLSAHCNMDQQSSFHCFGLFLGMQEKGSVSFGVDYEFSARSKPSEEFISKYKAARKSILLYSLIGSQGTTYSQEGFGVEDSDAESPKDIHCSAESTDLPTIVKRHIEEPIKDIEVSSVSPTENCYQSGREAMPSVNLTTPLTAPRYTTSAPLTAPRYTTSAEKPANKITGLSTVNAKRSSSWGRGNGKKNTC